MICPHCVLEWGAQLTHSILAVFPLVVSWGSMQFTRLRSRLGLAGQP